MAAELGIGWRREAGFETVAGPFTAVRLASRPLPFLAVLAVALTAADKIRSRQHASGASRSTECLDAETLRAAALILENATMRGESSAAWIGRDEIEWELSKTLREAAWVFENEKNGRFHGSIAACKGVARFIYLRGGGAELAGPFGQLAARSRPCKRRQARAFLKNGIRKGAVAPPERKHLHTPARRA